eukprot:272150-Chlamydomonas_euryale.AAC.5
MRHAGPWPAALTTGAVVRCGRRLRRRWREAAVGEAYARDEGAAARVASRSGGSACRRKREGGGTERVAPRMWPHAAPGGAQGSRRAAGRA